MGRSRVGLIKSYVRLCLALLLGIPTMGCFDGQINFSTLSSSGTSGNIQLLFQGTYSTSSSGSLSFSVVSNNTLPTVEVSYIDQSGNTLTGRTEGVSLTAFTDSKCTNLINPGDSSFVTAFPVDGKASFTGLRNTRAGTFYIQASATLNTGAKIYSDCSKPLSFTPGSAHHLADQANILRSSGTFSGQAGQAPSPVLSVVNGGASATLKAQVVDQYGNAVVPASPVSVVFSGFSTNVSGVSGSTGVVSTNVSGFASFVVSPTATMSPWAVYKVSASTGVLPGATTPLLFPIQLSGGTANKVLLREYPSRTFSSDPQSIFVTAADSASIPILDFNQSVKISNDSGATLRSVTLSLAGSVFDRIGVTAGAGVMAFFNGNTAPSGQVGSITPAPSVTDATVDCNQGPSGPSTSVAAATGDWSNPSGWLTSGFPGVPTAYNRAVISAGTSKALGPESSTNIAGCVQVVGSLNFQPNTTLQIKRGEFVLSTGGNVSVTQGSSGVLQFARGFSEGVGAQRLIFPENSSLALDILQLVPAVSGGSRDGYAFFVNGSSGSLRVDDFQLNSNVGNEHYGIYINTQMKINKSLTIPAGAEVVVTPGSSLTLSSGAVINGILTVLGGGSVVVGDNREIIVQSSGTLNLRGFGTVNSTTNVNNTFAHLKAVDSGSFAVAVSGGTLDASFFDVAGLSRVGSDSGFDIKSGSTVKNFKHGNFISWNQSFAALTLPSSFTLESGFLLDLRFSSSNISSSSGSIIDAQALSSTIGIVQSSFGSGSLSLKTYTSAPTGLIYWDF